MWNTNEGINLSNISVEGLPTLSSGEYVGVFVGAMRDKEDKQWVTIATHNSSHIECTDLDVSTLSANDKIEFKIAPKDGAFALMKGNRYALKLGDTFLTPWMDIQSLYSEIKDKNIPLAEPKIEYINKIERTGD